MLYYIATLNDEAKSHSFLIGSVERVCTCRPREDAEYRGVLVAAYELYHSLGYITCTYTYCFPRDLSISTGWPTRATVFPPTTYEQISARTWSKAAEHHGIAYPEPRFAFCV